MAGRTIEVWGIPYIPDEQLLVDFLEEVVGNGCVRTCRLMKSSSHESSRREKKRDRKVRAIVETEGAESAAALHNLAKAGILVFWCAALAVKFVSCPDPNHSLPPDLNVHDVPLDREICVYEQKSSIENLTLYPDVKQISSVEDLPSKPDVEQKNSIEDLPLKPDVEQNSSAEDLPLDPDVKQNSSVEDLSSEPDFEQKSSIEDLPLDSYVFVPEVAPDINSSEPKQLSEPIVSAPKVVHEPNPKPRPKFFVPGIFG